MDRFINALKQHANAMDGMGSQPRWATVTSVDPATHRVKVSLQPEGILTGWLPVPTQRTSGWTILCPPDVGDQVLVVPLENSHESLAIVGTAYSQPQPPLLGPAAIGGSQSNVSSTEWGAIHQQTGAVVRFCADGSVYIKAANVNIEGTLTVTGDIITTTGDVVAQTGNMSASEQITAVNGNITAANGDVKALVGDVLAETVSLNSHIHIDG